jgi:hypothetical protein
MGWLLAILEWFLLDIIIGLWDWARRDSRRNRAT